jgi:hypothetical protein
MHGPSGQKLDLPWTPPLSGAVATHASTGAGHVQVLAVAA